MQFVDGENLTIRGQAVAEKCRLDLRGDYYVPNSFLWVTGYRGRAPLFGAGGDAIQLEQNAIRSYYYTSTTGGLDVIQALTERIRSLDFDPQVFHKKKNSGRSKGVDIALATDLLGHAYRQNFDAAVLTAGDGDYLPLVKEVKRLGRIVHLWFFPEYTSDRLRLEADSFRDMTSLFQQRFPKRPEENT